MVSSKTNKKISHENNETNNKKKTDNIITKKRNHIQTTKNAILLGKSILNSRDKYDNREQNGLNPLEKLYNFMKKYRNETKNKTGKNIPWTHSMISEPFGSYDIPDDMYSSFLKLYEDAIVAGYKPYITEKHKEYGPIVIDFDFVHDKKYNKRQYTDKTIQSIIKTYNKLIKKYLDVSNNKINAYVLEKKEASLRNGDYHDGLHIIYPYICTKPSLQMLLRQDFIKLAEKYGIFNDINLKNNLENAFDKNVIYQSGWLLYGSRKNNKSYPYYITHIYHTANGKIFDTLVPNDEKSRSYISHLINATSCRRFHSEDEMTPLADGIDPIDVDNKINKIKEKIIDNTDKDNNAVAQMMGQDVNFIKAVSEELLIEAKNLVKLLSNERASEYYTWYQVGACLHNVDHRLLIDWIRFSKRTTKNNFREGECQKIWKKMKPNKYTMATLHYFASQDSPKRYLKLKEEKINILLKDGLQASHRTIAKLIMEKYKFIFKCASIKHNTWYQFKNHRWVEIDSAYSLRNLISDELTSEYGKRQSYLYDDAKEKKGYEKDKRIDEAVYISKVIKQLNNSTFKNGVIRDCADLAYDPHFLKNLDENIYLICFENGVYDLESDKFRDGCPDDYISLCTNYKYLDYDRNDENTKEIKDFFKKIQPDKIMREYLLILLSTCLAGSISEENFYVFTGSGANGKSKLMELLKHTMGDLFKPMDIQVLVGKRVSSSAATPEIADKKGIRITPLDEPKATDKINTSFMKVCSGGDEIMGRALFKDPVYFKPQFKPFLLCNHLPTIEADDEGTWRRLKVIPFLSKFVKMSDASKKMRHDGLPDNHFWADLNLSEKVPEWKEMFMGMLINYYRKYKKNGLVHPKLVTQETRKYRKRCDIYQNFIGDYLEETNNPSDKISVIALHQAMRNWYKSNYDGKCPNSKDLKAYLQQRMTKNYDAKIDHLTHHKIKQNGDLLDELEII